MEYESEVHDCGYHWSLVTDPDNVFMPEYKVCPVCRGSARFERIQGQQDESVRKQREGDPRAPDPRDGRHMTMRLLPAHEAAALRQSQSMGGRSSNARSAFS